MKKRAANTADAKAHAHAAELRLLISRFKRRMREQTNLGDFTLSQLSVMSRLDTDGPATVTALAQAEGVRPQSMGATIATLETAGIVSGEPDPNDGRRTLLSLTEFCREKVRSVRSVHEDWLFRAIKTRLNADERQQLAAAIALLQKLAEQ